MRIFRLLLALIVLAVIIAGGGLLALSWHGEIPAEEASARPAFDPQLVAHGAALASVGNCIACHTAPGKEEFSGGLALPTPFGTIYSTNITPDPETGIGRWSEVAFRRAMREGVDREGNELYPAFPFDHFTRVTDEDDRALYAYLMSRAPAHAVAPANELPFPLTFRPLLAGWKFLFFRSGAFKPEAGESDAWNRGAYLAEGLGHCGACHTPRNSLGAEDAGQHFAGGEAEGWHAHAINADSAAPVPWDKDSIAFYLRHGWQQFHGVSHGPMAEVTGNLSRLSDSDIDAIATYVASGMGTPSTDKAAKADQLRKASATPQGLTQVSAVPDPAADKTASMPGAAIYTATCSTCHDSGRAPPFGALNFKLNTSVNAPSPQNIVNVMLFGLPPADGQPSAVMPSFGGALNDQQAADLLAYIRARFTDKEPWQDVSGLVARTRSGQYKVTVVPSDGIERAPIHVGAKE
jgi:mono/diheme cytochrome c family protein